METTNNQPLTATPASAGSPTLAATPAPSPTTATAAPLPTAATPAFIPTAPTAPAAAPLPAAVSPAPLPVLTPGQQSSEFYLALAVVAAVVAALWGGKLDPALASALLGLIVSGYPALRTWLKSQHVDAVASVLAAQAGGSNGRGGAALGALAGALAAPDATGSPEAASAPKATGSGASLPPLASRALLAAALCALSGCAETPYYVSGINGVVDASKDGSRITGGGVAVTISPNPYYPLPKTGGLAK